jgi:hypothetical protein
MTKQTILEQELAKGARLGLDTSVPGFYNTPAFVAAERVDPTILDAYAAHILSRRYAPEYLSFAEERIRRTSAFLFKELRADGRLGACVDVSLVLGQFLERQGVWNFVTSGALSLHFKDRTVPPRTFYCFDEDPTPGAVAAHVWVFAPPFHVVDLSLPLQPYDSTQARYVLEPVLARDAELRPTSLSDLATPTVLLLETGRLGRTPKVEDLNPALPRRLELLNGTKRIDAGAYVADYTSCAVTASDGTIESAKNLCLNGKYPAELWEKYETYQPA